jgi:hypothetical protein
MEKQMSVAQTILTQIKLGHVPAKTGVRACQGAYAMMCWGARQFTDVGDGLTFKVSGRNVKGSVKVVYMDCSDLYDVHVFNTRGRELKHIEAVYCDQLAELIDDEVESA